MAQFFEEIRLRSQPSRLSVARRGAGESPRIVAAGVVVAAVEAASRDILRQAVTQVLRIWPRDDGW